MVQHEKLKNGGLPVVLSQTFRAIIHSRMKVGLSKYSSQYKNADVVLFEAETIPMRNVLANVFSYAERNKIAEHALSAYAAGIETRRRLQPYLRQAWHYHAHGCAA